MPQPPESEKVSDKPNLLIQSKAEFNGELNREKQGLDLVIHLV